MPSSTYLLAYGNFGDFAPFVSEDAFRFRRGDRLVIHSPRGQEIGIVMRPAPESADPFLKDHFVGKILRRTTSNDEELSIQLKLKSQKLFETSRRVQASLGLPIEILDAEILFDGKQAVLHFLRCAECDPRPLMEHLAEEYRVLVTLHDLALPRREHVEEHADHGSCGEGQCGSGGCGSCSTGGGCSTCGVHKHATPAAPAAAQESRVALL